MSLAPRAPVLALLAAVASGCTSISGLDDLAFDHDPAEPIPCIDPEVGMKISEDTNLCAGTFAMPTVSGIAAVEVVSSGVRLRCLDTVLDGTGSEALNPEEPTLGIQVGAVDAVVVEGCVAHGYRYGLRAQGASNLIVRDVHLDDNFTDAAADWTGDVPGGGIVFDAVNGGTVEASSFARNWNGIELRRSRDVVVTGNVADHCSNTGAIVVDSHDCELSGNDFSWAIRGDVSYPDSWYGIDTKDSAGIIVENASSGILLQGNDTRYGGNGIFIRDLYGLCPTDNVVQGNVVSFSPHNGIECWCDHNVFDGNTAEACHYGIWTGGADHARIVNNVINDSVVDGISIQIGENRHTLIQDNEVNRSGRVGILLSGREYQAWQPLTNWAPNLANSSHLVVQRNELFENVEADVFVTSTRLLLMAANCSPNHDGYLYGTEAELVVEMGGCGTGNGHTPPTPQLDGPTSAAPGAAVTFDASASSPSIANEPLTFTWLVQASAVRFPGGTLPTPLLSGPGAATVDVTFAAPGLYDVDLTVHDGRLAAMASQLMAVVPTGKRVGELAAEWSFLCPADDCASTFVDEPGGLDGTQVHLDTNSAYAFTMFAPGSRDMAFDASARTAVGVFLRARNLNQFNWQGSFPVVVLGSAAGEIRYEPDQPLLPKSPAEWSWLSVPLAGGAGWTRIDDGAVLSQVDWVELRMDTWGGGFDVWVDALTIY